MALELVSGADFLWKLMCGAGPVDLRGSRLPRGRPDPENDRFSAKSKTPFPWVPEGSLAGDLGCHEMALELVSGADFCCKLMSRGSPSDLGESRGRFPQDEVPTNQAHQRLVVVLAKTERRVRVLSDVLR